MSANKSSRHSLRIALRRRRSSLTPAQQKKAALALRLKILRLPLYIKAKTIAVYFSSDSEISLLPLTKIAWRKNKTVYLPRIYADNKMEFVEFTRHSRLSLNRFNIPEPTTKLNSRSADKLDIIFLPLVGFDNKGNRLGMGGGFYDRHLNNKKYSNTKLIGVAHECQFNEKIPTEKWDVRLDMIVTDKRVIHTRFR